MNNDNGMRIGGQMIAVGAMTGAWLAGGHNAGMRRVLAARAAREQEAYDAAVDEVMSDAEALGQIAMRVVRELADARAENAKLQRALSQRQSYIDRMNGRA